ncbi:hypothetical protein [Sphingopyxis sp. MSC1_008]|jgi:hypothetical protein|uniref:hypothetical protein n=1 Tax=Sphingopyxis sp. MSC1_008 TaxID=2909265 RepID=UPI0020C0A66E|nr:hypothetical protein [Sphingopyxis sp. MSC1_008]
MTRNTSETRWISRIWTAAVTASEAAVAIHYSAPWQRTAPRLSERTARDACAA